MVACEIIVRDPDGRLSYVEEVSNKSNFQQMVTYIFSGMQDTISVCSHVVLKKGLMKVLKWPRTHSQEQVR
jgi:hypothetical protein